MPAIPGDNDPLLAPYDYPRRGPGRVLVVDDDDGVRTVMTRQLKHAGFDVVAASNGPDGLDCMRNDPSIRVVLLDMIMPGMGGRELARSLAATRPTLPILFMSGDNDDGELTPGGDDRGVLAKPFTSETLARQVRETLDRRQPASSEAGQQIA